MLQILFERGCVPKQFIGDNSNFKFFVVHSLSIKFLNLKWFTIKFFSLFYY